METFYEILKVLSPDLRRKKIQVVPSQPSYVYLFSSDKTFQAYSDLTGIDGFFISHPDGNYIALEASRMDTTGVAYHEYLHQFLSANFPGVPLWLNEGLACFFQTMRREGPEIRLGRAPEQYFPDLVTQGILPVARLLAVTHTSPEYTTDPLRGQFYASSWLLIDYLMTGDDAKRAQLGTYLDLVRSGHALDECFRGAFGRAPAALDKELAGYLAQVKAKRAILTWVIRFATLKPAPAFAFSALARPEALGRLGLLQLSGKKDTDERAKEHFDAALALDPRCPAANKGLGLLAWMENRPEEAGPYFAKASQGDPDDAMLQYFAGASLLMGIPVHLHATTAEDRAVRSQARAHLLRAVELGCTQPDALSQLAAVVMMEDPPSSEDLAMLEAACRRLPGNFELKFKLAILYGRAAQEDLARACLREVAGQTVAPDLADQAKGQLQAMDTREAGRLTREADRLKGTALEAFKDHRYAEAVAALEAAIQLAPAGQKKGFQDDLDTMKVLIELRTRPKAAPGRKSKGNSK